jgi:hypothetical protein
MKLTPKYFEALNKAVLNPVNTKDEGTVKNSSTCCGVYELTLLAVPKAADQEGRAARAINRALNGYETRLGTRARGLGMIVYYAPITGNPVYRDVLQLLKDFGFQSMGTFFNPNTNNDVEAVYFHQENPNKQ